MTDYGHELEFGYFLVPGAGNAYGVLETARLADGLGYDLLAVQDHPYGFGTFILLGPPDPDLLHTFTEDVAPDVRERVAAARAQDEPVAATAGETSQ